jgi:hypothetical protein
MGVKRMKIKLLVFFTCLVPFSAMAVEYDTLTTLLANAAVAQSNAYIEVRTTIVDFGTNAIPSLAQAAVDQDLSWQQRLSARICYEHVERGDEIEALRRYDWRSYPPYSAPIPKIIFHTNEVGKIVSSEVHPSNAVFRSILGPQVDMEQYVVPECRKSGLWYYYIELTWKQTKENGLLEPCDMRFEQAWAWWCRKALEDQPEESFLTAAIIERLEGDPDLVNRECLEFYRAFVNKHNRDAIQVILQLYDAYFKQTVPQLEIFPGSLAMTSRSIFKTILSFADSSHIAMLEKFIDERPDLAELKPKLEEVRLRPPQPSKPEPPFRLGTTPVKTP